jgi:transcription initiation factor TFIID subunit 11
MMQVVCKMYLGDIVEAARDIQQEWIEVGEKQTDLVSDDLEPSNELSKYRRQAPLRPDHLREAYRRRKAAAENGGALGSLMVWNQQTQNGVGRFAVRAGGRRVFR